MSQSVMRFSRVLVRFLSRRDLVLHPSLSSAKSPQPKMGNIYTAQNKSTITSDVPAQPPPDNEFRRMTDAEWRERLTKEQYKVCREKGTEPPFTGEYVDNKQKGTYTCVGCGAPLFESETKYDSGSGWPSFYQKYEREDGSESVITKADHTLHMSRTEVLCGQCDSHLGHVFPDGPRPTGMRYCINSISLKFKPDNEGKM